VLATTRGGQICTIQVGKKFIRMKAMDTVLLGHRIALAKIEKNSDVYKYGERIGIATKNRKRSTRAYTTCIYMMSKARAGEATSHER